MALVRFLYAASEQPEAEATEDACKSIDIGTANFALVRVVKLARQPPAYVLTHAAILDLRRPRMGRGDDEAEQESDSEDVVPLPRQRARVNQNGSLRDDADAIGQSLRDLFLNDHRLGWVWRTQGPVLVERQDRDKRPVPIMQVIYGALEQLVQLVARPSPWHTPRTDGLGLQLGWVSRSGKQKYGLRGVHGYEERKRKALEIGAPTLRALGDDAGADWVAGLPAVVMKPRQDACDAVLQALSYLSERAERRAIDARKLERKRKREEKEQAAARKLELKRKREEDGPAGAERDAKRRKLTGET
jgi:hypothetical protein